MKRLPVVRLTVDGVQHKTCSRVECRKLKPLSDFGPNKNTRDGLQSYCKECGRRVQATRRKDESVTEYDRAQRRAYDRAEARLREAHRRQWEQYYEEEDSNEEPAMA